MTYHRLKQNTMASLIEIVGKSNLSTKEEDLRDYSIDESALPQSHAPDAIVKPINTRMVSQILSFAHINRIPVTPRGGGTGVSGGCVPQFGGIVLSLEAMNHVLKIDSCNFLAIVEPGVTLTKLNEEVLTHNLYYPIHIGEMTATLGGSISTNAGGMNAVKYGVTRHHVLGLEAVLPTGEILYKAQKHMQPIKYAALCVGCW